MRPGRVSLALLVLWVACTVLHVKQVASGHLAWVGVYVAAPSGADGFPTVRGFWPGATARHVRRAGDRRSAAERGRRRSARRRTVRLRRAHLRGSRRAPRSARSARVRTPRRRRPHDDRARPGRVPVAHAAAHLHPGGHRLRWCWLAGRARASRAASFFSRSPTACTGRSSSAARAGRPTPGWWSSSAPRW